MILLLGLAAACPGKREPPPAATPRPDAAVAQVDAGPPDAALDAGPPISADEAARRLAKRDGVAVADQAPEVVTEALIDALGTGRASLAGYLDGRRGTWLVTQTAGGRPQVEHRCAGAAGAVLADHVGRVLDYQRGGAAARRVACDNRFLDGTTPAPAERADVGRHATCTSQAAGDGAPTITLVFAPVAAGDLRFLAAIVVDDGQRDDAAWQALGQALRRPPRCRA
ncbi:MAG: hypothetical protein R3B06_13850 [Kofleriaceae bacterium]